MEEMDDGWATLRQRWIEGKFSTRANGEMGNVRNKHICSLSWSKYSQHKGTVGQVDKEMVKQTGKDDPQGLCGKMWAYRYRRGVKKRKEKGGKK